jgi:excisionase family DNA binding protein
MGRILDKNEAAEIFKISPVTLDRLRKKGLPFHKVGSQIRFDEDELKEWFKEQK